MNIDWIKRFAVTPATAFVLATLLLLSVAQAAEVSETSGHENMTQSFKVRNMTCATCPLTVKAAIKRLEGVISVDVDSETELATVVYDPTIVTVEEIASASTNVGFPTSVLE